MSFQEKEVDLSRPIEIPFYVDRLIELNCCGTCKICSVRKICHEAIQSINSSVHAQEIGESKQ